MSPEAFDSQNNNTPILPGSKQPEALKQLVKNSLDQSLTGTKQATQRVSANTQKVKSRRLRGTVAAKSSISEMYTRQKASQNQETGLQLNQIDAKLIPQIAAKNIESPTQRLLVMRFRLEEQLKLYEEELLSYEALNNPMHMKTIATLQNKILNLNGQLEEIKAALSDINPFQKMFDQTQKTIGDDKHPNSIFRWVQQMGEAIGKKLLGEFYQQEMTLEAYYQEFKGLQVLLKEHFHDPSMLSAGKLSQLMCQFDKDMRSAEKLQSKLYSKQRKK